MYQNRQPFLPLPPFVEVEEEVVVGLTSYGERISHILPTLETLVNQTRKPDRIVLYIATDDISLVTDDIKGLCEVRECQDIKSHKKFNVFWDFPDAYTITADDDLLYKPDWLEVLMRASQLNRNCVTAHNTFLMTRDGWGRPTTRRDNLASLEHRLNMYLMTGAGTLRPPHIDLSLLKYAYEFSPFCDEKPMSALLQLLHIPVLATRLTEPPYNTECYKLPTGGLWEQHNQKGQVERWKECWQYIDYIKKEHTSGLL